MSENFYREVKQCTRLSDLIQILAGKKDLFPAEKLEKGHQFVEEVLKALTTFGNVKDKYDIESLKNWLLIETISRDDWSLGNFIDPDVRVAVMVYLGRQYMG